LPAAAPAPFRAEERETPSPERFFGALDYLGQLDRTYLVCEADGELVLIDQHAAHERVAFQRLREAHASSGPRTQRLLFPRVLELEPDQAAAAGEHAEALAAIGFELSPFGGRSFAMKAAPVDLRDDDQEPTLRELLTDLSDRDASRAIGDRLDHMFATIACHSVVRAGDTLSRDEAHALLSSMDSVDYRAHCPHGRPVLLRISISEIARRFGRT
jgi:DNA mismatch repair protein MutL